MADFHGRLSHAPVVYVLCQIRFSPVEKMADYVPSIQEALRFRYPNFETEQVGGMKWAGTAQPVLLQNETRWRFESRDLRTGFVLQTNQLITHTTNYLDSDDFREQILFAFRIIHEVAKLGFVQRVGLRYIDLITATEDDAVEDYIDSSLLGFRPNLTGLIPDVSQQFVRARSNVAGASGILLMKMSRAQHGSELPADLLPVSLRLVRKPLADRESIFLDWDHYVEHTNLDPDPALLETTIKALKGPIATVFKAAITEHAVKQWTR